MTDDGELVGLIVLVIAASVAVQYGSAFVLDTPVPWYAACTVSTLFLLSSARIDAVRYKRRSERLHERSVTERKKLEAALEELRTQLRDLEADYREEDKRIWGTVSDLDSRPNGRR